MYYFLWPEGDLSFIGDRKDVLRWFSFFERAILHRRTWQLSIKDINKMLKPYDFSLVKLSCAPEDFLCDDDLPFPVEEDVLYD